MIQIRQVLLNNDNDKTTYEKINHQNAFEYIPSAKGEDYISIADGEDVIFLTIKITSNNEDEAEREIIEKNLFSKAMSSIRAALMRHKGEFDILSISHINGSANLSEGMVINALLLPNNGLLPEETINNLIIEMYKTMSTTGIPTPTPVPSAPAAPIVPTVPVSTAPPIPTNPDVNNTVNVENESAKKPINVTSFVEANMNTYNDANMNNRQTAEIPVIPPNMSSGKSLSDINKLGEHIPTGQETFSQASRLAFQQAFGVPEAEGKETSVPDIDSNYIYGVEKINAENTDKSVESPTVSQMENIIPGANDNNFLSVQGKIEVSENIPSENHYSTDETKDNIHTDKEDVTETVKETVSNKESYNVTSYGQNASQLLSVQREAYEKSNEKQPFLNTIDRYIPSTDIRALEDDSPMYEIYPEDENIKTTASKDKLRASFNQTMRYFMENEHTLMTRTLKGEVERSKFMNSVRVYVNNYLKIPEEDMEMFIRKFEIAFFSYYVLTPAIKDPAISDIRVLAPDNINVKVHGVHKVASGLKFIDENDYSRFIDGLIIRNKIKITNPIIVFTDKDFDPDYILRFNLCLPHINSTGMPYLHIRKVPKKKTTLKDLINAGMLDEKLAAYLLDKVNSSRGLVFAGPSASGKTTLMNALLDYIPKDKSVLCIQESEELFSHIHPNVYFQHMLKGARGETLIGLSELGQNGLLCDSGYFIIGECKGSEVRDLLRASNTGHRCWCSVHAQSSKETIPRLADYVKYGADYSLKEATRMLKDLETIVYIEGFKITEITEIAGYDDDKERIIYRPVYRRNV